MKWDSKTSPDNFRKECSANKDIVREIEKIHLIKCANQLDVINLNDKFVGIYSLIERNIGTCQSERKPNTNRTLQNTRKNKLKHKWFDSECILRKRELRKAERIYVKKPTDDDSRSLYYTIKKEYRKLIKNKEKTSIDGIAEDILQNNSLSWDTVKKLQSEICPRKSTLDTFDLERFYSFFKELYKEKRIELPGKQSLQSHEKEQDENRAAVTSILNEPITLEELMVSTTWPTNTLKRRMITSYEAHLLSSMSAWIKEFYPWNTTIITPLHKKVIFTTQTIIEQ